MSTGDREQGDTIRTGDIRSEIERDERACERVTGSHRQHRIWTDSEFDLKPQLMSYGAHCTERVEKGKKRDKTREVYTGRIRENISM